MINLETPAFIVKKEVLQNSIDLIQSSLDKYFPKNVFSYSLKTNSLPYILKKIKSAGGYAEVVSSDEYELARLVGFDINNIVYNGLLKSKSTFLESIEKGAIVNIDSQREIDWLDDLPKNKSFSVGIRINIDLDIISPKDAKVDEGYSRFGFSPENKDFKNAVSRITSHSNINLIGVHVHRTTLSRSVDVYEKIALYVGEVVKEYCLNIQYIDIGGGFYGIMDDKPTFDEYFDSISKGLSSTFDLNEVLIIIEPGNAIVASALDFISSVIDVKKIKDFHVITTDGSRNDLDPFYKKSAYFHTIIASNPSGSIVPLQVVAGGTCLEYDKIFELEDTNLLKLGDLIKYKSVGAYTMTLSPLFIRYFPNIYLEDNGEYILIRKKWSAADFYSIYNTSE
ncbi:diaminopimelate decarboxylase [Psychrobacter urativorans]|uniref:diaminopimelate decarboxylase n=1 Tax=Psychrobacter urativorans TaxID=45610 RepID=UPI00191A3409|nr:diaminopimelate decarboxylase [Psychrobacter urativorans]